MNIFASNSFESLYPNAIQNHQLFRRSFDIEVVSNDDYISNDDRISNDNYFINLKKQTKKNVLIESIDNSPFDINNLDKLFVIKQTRYDVGNCINLNSEHMELECSICFSVFNDPYKLICGHSFCRKLYYLILRALVFIIKIIKVNIERK